MALAEKLKAGGEAAAAAAPPNIPPAGADCCCCCAGALPPNENGFTVAWLGLLFVAALPLAENEKALLVLPKAGGGAATVLFCC